MVLAHGSVVNNLSRAQLWAFCATGRGSGAKKAPSCVRCLLLPLSPLLAVISLPTACDQRQRGFLQAASKVTLPKEQKSKLQIPDHLKSHRATFTGQSACCRSTLPSGTGGAPQSNSQQPCFIPRRSLFRRCQTVLNHFL